MRVEGYPRCRGPEVVKYRRPAARWISPFRSAEDHGLTLEGLQHFRVVRWEAASSPSTPWEPSRALRRRSGIGERITSCRSRTTTDLGRLGVGFLHRISGASGQDAPPLRRSGGEGSWLTGGALLLRLRSTRLSARSGTLAGLEVVCRDCLGMHDQGQGDTGASLLHQQPAGRCGAPACNGSHVGNYWGVEL